jgi:hypothetical protein
MQWITVVDQSSRGPKELFLFYLFDLTADSISMLLVLVRGLDLRGRLRQLLNTKSTSMIHLLGLRRTRRDLLKKGLDRIRKVRIEYYRKNTK